MYIVSNLPFKKKPIFLNSWEEKKVGFEKKNKEEKKVYISLSLLFLTNSKKSWALAGLQHGLLFVDVL